VSTTEHNGGADTLITLNDGSTILLKGASHFPSLARISWRGRFGAAAVSKL
jgi:hypothetical protein